MPSDIISVIQIFKSMSYNYNLTINQFSVLTSGSSDLELSIKESLFIKTNKPKLNNKKSVSLKTM